MNEITITINGVEYIARPKEDADPIAEDKPKTGYERVDDMENYFYMSPTGEIVHTAEGYFPFNDGTYEIANYHNDATIAENNERADRLMRKLRQWQALNDNPVDWSDTAAEKYVISCDCENKRLSVTRYSDVRQISVIYFSTREKAFEAMKVFHGELAWYFTEYMQRLDEPGRRKEEVKF